MSTGAWILFGVVELALLAAAVKGVRLWRDETDTFDGRPLGRVRSYPFAVSSALVFVALIMGLAAVGTRPASAASVVLTAASLLVVGAAVVVTRSLRRRGRPEALVPPHLRGIDAPPDRPVSRGRLRDAG